MRRTMALLLALVWNGRLSAQISSSTARHITWGASLPATCTPNTGDVYFKTTATVGPYYCSATNTWTAMSGGGGSPSGAAGGDLTGTYPNPTIKLSFVPDPTVAPTVALAGLGAGSVDNGDHCYGYTFGFSNATGVYSAQTYPSAYVTVTVVDKTINGQVQLTIPVSPDPRVTQRIIYRTKAGASCGDPAQFILAFIGDNTTTSYIDNSADSDLNTRYPPLDYATTATAITVGNYPNGKTPFSDSGAAIAGIANLVTTVPSGLPMLLGVNPTGYVTLTAGIMSGATGSIGGGLLTSACTAGTAAVTGATSGMAVAASPAADPGTGVTWDAFVSGADTVTVRVCTVAAITPTATTYNVRVLP